MRNPVSKNCFKFNKPKRHKCKKKVVKPYKYSDVKGEE